MIHVIMGLKGSGKTKKLIDAINAAVADAHGDVVCIEYGKKLTYDVTYKVRLVDSQEYGISSPDMLKGFLSACMQATLILPTCSSTTCIRPSVRIRLPTKPLWIGWQTLPRRTTWRSP